MATSTSCSSSSHSALAIVLAVLCASSLAWAAPAVAPPVYPSPPSPASGINGSVPTQCTSALLAFTSCLPSLASMVGSGSGSSIPSGFMPSSGCCSSLQSIDPTCFCTLLSEARQFFGSSLPSDGGAHLTAAAYQLPSLCGLHAQFIPSS